MASSLITNISGNVFTFPTPYRGILRPGESTAVARSAKSVIANLGGDAAIVGVLCVTEILDAGVGPSLIPSPIASSAVFDVTDFGAKADAAFNGSGVCTGGTDNGPAFQAALDAAYAAGGGKIFIPPGNYRQVAGVYKLGTATGGEEVEIYGTGASVIVPDMGLTVGGPNTKVAWQILNGGRVRFRDLVVRSPRPINNTGDCDTLFMTGAGVYRAFFERIHFYGVTAGYSIIRTSSSPTIRGCLFEGCVSGASGSPTYSYGANIHLAGWTGEPLIENCRMIDYGNYRGVFFSNGSWIGVLMTDGPGDSISGGAGPGTLVVRKCGFDEGAYYQVMAYFAGAASRGWQLVVEDCSFLTGGVLNAASIYAARVDRVDIKRINIGARSNDGAPTHWGSFWNCGRIEVDGVLLHRAGGTGKSFLEIGSGAYEPTGPIVIRDAPFDGIKPYLGAALTVPIYWDKEDGVRAAVRVADAAITAGDLVVASATTNNRVITAPTSAVGSQVLGVALDAATGAGQFVRVAMPGQRVKMRLDSGGATRGDSLTTSNVTAGSARSAAFAAGAQVGRALASGASGATIDVEFSPR
jgi:hypothetical protein